MSDDLDDAQLAELKAKIEADKQQIEASVAQLRKNAELMLLMLRPIPPLYEDN